MYLRIKKGSEGGRKFIVISQLMPSNIKKDLYENIQDFTY